MAKQLERRSDCIHGRERTGPVLLCIARTPINSMAAILGSKEKGDSEHSPFHENISPINSFAAHLLCLLGCFPSSPLPILLLISSFMYILELFLLQLNGTESWCCIFLLLAKQCKILQSKSQPERGVTMTSQTREIHIFFISLKKQQFSLHCLSIKGTRAPSSCREPYKLSTELPARKNNQTVPSGASWPLEEPQQLHLGAIPGALASQSSSFTLHGKLYIPTLGGSREGKSLETEPAGKGLEAATEGVGGS